MSGGACIAVRSLSRSWTDNAIRLIEADARRSADTHLLRYPLPAAWCTDVDVELYLKDETTHITGSLKHRLARSLFLYALCNGWINENTTVVEASSGSTAVSEAYFAALLGLPFIAVMPAATSASKIALIESQGGRCHFVQNSSQVYAEAERVAKETGGHYLDQFTNAERATDWRGNNNIAESIYVQMREEKHPGTTEAHRSAGFVGFTNRYAAANYIYDDSSSPTDLCSGPLRHCGSGDLYGGNEPSRTWFAAMKPIANNFGEVQLPPTDPRYVDGAPGSRVPSVAGLDVDAARQRLKDAGFQVADQTNSVNSSAKYGEVVGTSPSGQTIPGSIVTIQISNGIPPAPPPPPLPEDGGPPPPVGSQVVEIPGLPPITIPLLAPPPPAPPP